MATSRRPLRPDDLLAGCDREQIEAITTPRSPLCILAGAGSGKTRVLTRRIAWRVIDASALAPHVLALTFTRKAAAELRGRLGALGLPESVTAGTFHAVALAELRRLAAERRLAPPVILSSKSRLLHTVAAGRPPAPAAAENRRRRAAAAGGGLPVHEIAAEIEWAKSRLVTPEAYPRAAAQAGREPVLPHAEVAEWFDGYERERRRRRLLDFEDLLTVCAAELGSDHEFAASARWRFRHVFVDEYQDVNSAQLALLKAWCAGNGDVCVVGDPDQAIYGWNGADPRAIGRFSQDFPGGATIRLGTNYRSTAEILEVAASVLEGAQPAPAGGPLPEGPVPTVTVYATEREEAAGVAERVRLAHRPGRRWSQIAVLARTNAQLRAFEDALAALGVPCRVTAEAGFFRRPHVAAAMSELEQAAGAGALAALAKDLTGATPPDGAADEEAEETASDLRELGVLVEEYLGTDAVATGAGFRSFAAASARSLGPAGGADAVELSTFHRAKGLEWPVVFLTGLEDGLVPIAHARDADALAEERRLLYVACTRAEEELHCSYATKRRFGSERASEREPSPYLAAVEAARRRLLRRSSGGRAVAREALAESRRALGGAGSS